MSFPSAFLEEIRAEPLTNYCAWNEPNVPVRRRPAAAGGRWRWLVTLGVFTAVVVASWNLTG